MSKKLSPKTSKKDKGKEQDNKTGSKVWPIESIDLVRYDFDCNSEETKVG